MDITVLMENAKQIRMSYSTLQPRYVLELFNYDIIEVKQILHIMELGYTWLKRFHPIT